jgi:hypothetical protein
MRKKSKQPTPVTLELADTTLTHLRASSRTLRSTANQVALALLLPELQRADVSGEFKKRQFQLLAASLFRLCQRLNIVSMGLERAIKADPGSCSRTNPGETRLDQVNQLLRQARQLLDLCLGIAAGQYKDTVPALQSDLREAASIANNILKAPSASVKADPDARALAEYLILLKILPDPRSQM